MVVALSGLAQGAREEFDSGLFWRVSRSGVPDSFVLGTIHIPDVRVSTVPDDARAALARSRVLATELVLRMVGDHLPDAEWLTSPLQLSTLLGAKDFDRLAQRLATRDIPRADLDRMKPWAALLRLAPADDTTGATLDESLYAIARAHRLPVRTLESADEQLAAFDVVPLATQVAVLRDALDRPDAAARERAVSAYRAGDLAALAALPPSAARDPALARHYGILVKHLVEDRTVVMHHGLFVPLRSGGVFVAVGASHLYGRRGLLAMLRADGYRVTRLR